MDCETLALSPYIRDQIQHSAPRGQKTHYFGHWKTAPYVSVAYFKHRQRSLQLRFSKLIMQYSIQVSYPSAFFSLPWILSKLYLSQDGKYHIIIKLERIVLHKVIHYFVLRQLNEKLSRKWLRDSLLCNRCYSNDVSVIYFYFAFINPTIARYQKKARTPSQAFISRSFSAFFSFQYHPEWVQAKDPISCQRLKVWPTRYVLWPSLHLRP